MDRELERLPNGLEVAFATLGELRYQYYEIFQSGASLRHGLAIPPGAHVFDVGANIGMFSLFAHLAAEGRCHIHAFEPAPEVADILRFNLSSNGVDAEVFDTALGAADGRASFTLYPAATACSGLHRDPGKLAETMANVPLARDQLWRFTQFESIDVPVTTLSRVMREQGVTAIDLLKVDTEGNELDVLRGIDRSQWPRIRQVLVELHNDEADRELIAAHVEEHGFEVVVETTDQRLHMLYARRAASTG